MSGFKALLLNEWRATARKLVPLFLSFFLPFLLLGVLGYSILLYVQDGHSLIQVAVVDEDQTFETKALIHQLQEEEQMKNTLLLDRMSSQTAQRKLTDNQITGIIIIPKGFTNDLRIGKNTPIQVLTNSQKPIASNMVELLLNSGAKYISASQSAVNTVYDLSLSEIEGKGERNQKLQQSIITFTLFALSRNDLFEKKKVLAAGTIGWTGHALVALYLTGVSFSFLLFQWWFQSHLRIELQQRLRIFHVSQFHFLILDAVKYFIYLLVVSELFVLFSTFIFSDVKWVSLGVHLRIIVVSLFMTMLLLNLNQIISNGSTRTFLFGLVVILGLLMGGVWLPEIYFSEHLQWAFHWNPFYHMYQLLTDLFVSNASPLTRDWLHLFIWIISMTGTNILLAWRRESKHGYVSLVK